MVANILFKTVNWNEAAKVLTKNYDFLIEVASKQDGAARRQGFIEFENQMELDQGKMPFEIAKAVPFGKGAKGRVFGKVLSGMLMPSVYIVSESLCRYQSERDLVRIYLALETFKAVQGKYPSKLSELVPDYIDAIPNDSFTSTAFKYVPPGNESEFALYSFGSDGVDDGGADRHDHSLPLFKQSSWDEYLEKENSDSK